MSWVWFYDKQTDMDALNAERQRQLDDIYMCGGFLDLGTDEERAEPVQQSEPQAVEPLQLALF